MLKPERISDAERRLWILNNENLYNWYKSEKEPMVQFIRRNRAELDEVIELKLERRGEHDTR